KSFSQSLPRRRPASPRILIQHASPEDDRQPRTLETPECQTLGRKQSDSIRGHLHSGASLSSAAAASAARRVRQLPQLPPQSSSVEQ
ncbi:hypothetical protein XENORESO_007878, partial [Xenotaenia resolanae]